MKKHHNKHDKQHHNIKKHDQKHGKTCLGSWVIIIVTRGSPSEAFAQVLAEAVAPDPVEWTLGPFAGQMKNRCTVRMSNAYDMIS